MRERIGAALLAAAFACAGAASAMPAAAQESLKLIHLVHRTGPFAAGGAALADGQRDYIAMINGRDGGINGVLLDHEECDVGSDAEGALRCLEAAGEDAVAVLSSVPEFVPELAAAGHRAGVPLLAPGQGPSAMADGRVFRWAFNAPATPLQGASILLAHAADGDLARLAGRKIALLHSDSAAGREPVLLLERYAERHGFTFLPLPVAAARMQNQAAQWQRIKDEDPDFVLLWGWGTMSVAALAEARRTGFPADRIFGTWWAGHDGGLAALAGEARGFRIVTFSLPVRDAPVLADIGRYAGGAGGAGIFYQRGLVMATIAVEAIRTAQEKFDQRRIDAAQMRWGMENLDLDESRLAELGMAGMIAPVRTGCADHAGGGSAWIAEWDGTGFVPVSGPLAPDAALAAALQAQEARRFAEEDASWPTGPECNGG